MNRKIITLLLLAIFTNFGYSQSDKINIKTEHLTEANYLKMDDFYLTHYLYIDLFLRENLFPEANAEDVSSILKALKKYVSVENKLDIEIEKPGKRNYLIRFTILKKDDGTELLIAFTNWSVKKKEFEKDIKMENDSYTRWYFLNGNKMTYRKDMSDQSDYSTMNKSDLANAYLFDEISENDSEIKNTIDEYLNQSELSVSDKIMANLILLKYQIFQKENDNVNKQTEYITELFEKNKSESNLRGLQAAFNATIFQIELSK
ncbi:hypothetical protein [Polaribacter sp. AHE13PA]|uniref:hypothetical protein n=1 Tax=Polaribacter sp. AHE13PA TaxID=2745562 RepID=UPI001C4FAE8D|nr:hypothetical protein [Polaribacter sp. AHE13PA]QXP68524.1 hypothetical protein H0I28_08580 [Polaribacter sp. AHE13PA]